MSTQFAWSGDSAGPLLSLFDELTDPQGDWQIDALCAETWPDAFFPEKGGSTREAKAICRRCPVRAACLRYALETDQRFGIWGATSERERRTMRRSLNQQGSRAA